MRMIHVVLPKAVAFLLGVASIQAQGQLPAMVGMPEYGVTLSGTPENPVVENHSGRVVIGYFLKSGDTNGRGLNLNQVVALSVEPAGIPDGGSVYAMGAVPVNSTVPMPSPPVVRGVGQGPIVRATLQSVIFADGQFVGVDGPGGFEEFVKKIRAITEAGKLAKTGAWDQVEAFAQLPPFPPPNVEDRIVYFGHRQAATWLVQERKRKGDAAATKLAEIYSSLPTLWK